MSLTDSEKRDLISLIENNKPIPEEYRFKIFKNKNEIELLWNGKNYETTNVNLPFQIIENVDEPRKKIEPELLGFLPFCFAFSSTNVLPQVKHLSIFPSQQYSCRSDNMPLSVSFAKVGSIFCLVG